MFLSTKELRGFIENNVIYILSFSDEVGTLSVSYGMNAEGDEFLLGFKNVDCSDSDYDRLAELSRAKLVIAYNSSPLRALGIECIDYKIYRWYHENVTPKIVDPIIDRYLNWYPHVADPVTIIPIMKVLELARTFVGSMRSTVVPMMSAGFLYYHDTYHRALEEMASNGIAIDPSHRLAENISGNIIYPSTTIQSLTGRPSISYRSINLNALSKKNDDRALIVSRFPGGRLFEFDYDSFHLRIIAKLIGYEFPDGNIHEFFARKYFPGQIMTQDVYERAKALTFKNLYSDSGHASGIEFFERLEAYKVEQYSRYCSDGKLTTPLVGRELNAEWHVSMNKDKLFSYLVQATESEINASTLRAVLDYLYPSESKLILYTYDSFLFDYSPNDGREVLHGLKKILEIRGFPTSISAGINYQSMINVSL